MKYTVKESDQLATKLFDGIGRPYCKQYNDLDSVWPTLSLAAQAILRVINRRTVGFHKRSAEITYSQLKKHTGIKSDATIKKATDELDNNGLISRSLNRNTGRVIYKILY